MEKHAGQCTTQIEDLREGSARCGDTREPASARQSGVFPAVRLPHPAGPAGETGVLPAVPFIAEGQDRTDSQDASRTTAENAAVPAKALDEQANGERPLVLIVEDAAELAELLRVTLERNQIRAVVETHAQRALERCHEMKPDLLLLDIGLPDMTGWKLLDTLRETAGSAMPDVIVITAYGDAANRLVGKFQNVHTYLVKPFTSDEVTGAVRKALNGKVG